MKLTIKGKKYRLNRNRLIVLFAITTLVVAATIQCFASSGTDVEKVNAKVSEEVQQQIEVKSWNVPLESDLQTYIAELSIENGLEPEIVFAVIGMESNYKADRIGDNGHSFGLMQVQEKWHTKRMEKLSCDDLLNPYDNVAVGIDLLGELVAEGHGIEWSLMAYNGGRSYATEYMERGEHTEYVDCVLKLAKEIGGDDNYTF